MLNWSQVSGAIDRLVFIGLGYAAGQGIIQSSDVQILAPAIVALIGAGYSVYQNRVSRLAQRTISAQPGTTIIMPKEVADTVPSASVVSSTDYEVKPK